MTSVSSSVKLACSRFRKQSRVSAEGSWQLLNLITSVTCSRKRAARQKLFVHALHSNPTSRPRSKHRQTPAASPLFWHHSLSISKMTKFTDKAGDRSAQQEAGRAQLSPSVYRLPWPSPHSRMAEAAARRGGKKSNPAAPGPRSSTRVPPMDQKVKPLGVSTAPVFALPRPPRPRSTPTLGKDTLHVRHDLTSSQGSEGGRGLYHWGQGRGRRRVARARRGRRCSRLLGFRAHFLFRFGKPWWVESREPQRRVWDDAKMAAVSRLG